MGSSVQFFEIKMLTDFQTELMALFMQQNYEVIMFSSNNLLEMYKIYWDTVNSLDMPTEKIIFWESGNFFPFFLANSLQKKINGEFYAIFDVPDRKK